jgi:hypothetical protein
MLKRMNRWFATFERFISRSEDLDQRILRLQQLLAGQISAHGRYSWITAGTQFLLINALEEAGRSTDACSGQMEIVNAYKHHFGSEDKRTLRQEIRLVHMYERSGLLQQAHFLAKHAHDTLLRNLGPDSSEAQQAAELLESLEKSVVARRPTRNEITTFAENRVWLPRSKSDGATLGRSSTTGTARVTWIKSTPPSENGQEDHPNPE